MCISITEENGRFCARFTDKYLHAVGYGCTRLKAVTHLMDEVPDYAYEGI